MAYVHVRRNGDMDGDDEQQQTNRVVGETRQDEDKWLQVKKMKMGPELTFYVK